MRIAVVSDIHGNLPALEAVAARISERGCDQVWCLGDVVGYGAHPNECCEWVRTEAAVCLAGNHDLAVEGSITEFNSHAKAAMRWTRKVLTAPALEWLRSLSPSGEANADALVFSLYHGSALEPESEYVDLDNAVETIDAQANRFVLVGHTHVPMAVPASASPDGEFVDSDPFSGVIETFDPRGTVRHLWNPGSVGQPRDEDPRASWLELDTGGWAFFHRVNYDVDLAARAIREAGLPKKLADRLYDGV